MFLSELWLNDERKSGARRRCGWPRAQLLQEREQIGYAPVLDDFAVTHAHDIDGLELDLATRRRHAKEFSPVHPVIGFVRRHPVAIGKRPMNVGVKVGKGPPENFV